MIDARELRVGNHISVEGERCYVESIQGNGSLVGYITPQGDWEATDPMNDWIEPIPLTAGLLTEIGFVKRTRCDNDKDYYIDAESAGQMERTRLVIPQIEIQNYSEIGNPELWEIKIISTDNTLAVEHKTTVRYLYELENFVYMTLKSELIEG